MGINFKLDTKGLEAKIKDHRKKTEETLVKELNTFGINTVNDAKRLAPVNEGFLRNSISMDAATKSQMKVTVVVAANYAAFVEFGTRSFAAAYVATLPANWQAYAATFRGKTGGSMEDFIMRLVEWVRKKGIAAQFSVKTRRRTGSRNQNATDDYAAAYQIALSILRKGIKAQPFLYPSYEKNKIELLKRLQ